jgi:MFS transporter, DHA3 family, macrolide efflux protein
MEADPTATEPTPTTSPLRLLANRNFRRLWIGSVTSAAGASIGSIILIWLVYSATHSALTISVLGIVQFLPTLGFGLLAGALIDRLDRRRLMMSCDVARAVTFGAIAIYVLLFGVQTTTLIAVVFVVATFSTIFRPATNAAIPRLLRRDELSDGNGLLQGGSTIAQFVGSPVGGLIIITVGAAVGLAINALTFAVSGAMIFLMVIPGGAAVAPGVPTARRSLLRDVGDGLRYLRSQRALLIITLSAMGANFFLSIWGGFLVVYAAVHLHEGATGFAILVASNTAGFGVGAILPGRLHTDRAPGRWLIAAWGLCGFFIIGLAAAPSLAVAVALTVSTAVLLSVGNTTWLSGVQRTVPDEFMGRYFATDEAGSFAMIPAGLAVGGVLIVLYGIGWAFLIAGVGAVALNLPMLLSPTVRAWGRVPPATAPAG